MFLTHAQALGLKGQPGMLHPSAYGVAIDILRPPRVPQQVFQHGFHPVRSNYLDIVV